MENSRKDKAFLKKPQYPGGKEAFRKFIKENLKYPKEAFDKNIEGTVFISYHVNDNGNVFSTKVTKGIGYGCDAEAIRLINLLKFDKVKNRGVRLSVNMKTRINFKIEKKQTQINYSLKEEEMTKIESEEKKPVNYTYTITNKKK